METVTQLAELAMRDNVYRRKRVKHAIRNAHHSQSAVPMTVEHTLLSFEQHAAQSRSTQFTVRNVEQI